MTKSEVFFFLRISQPRCGNYCVFDGVCTHSVSHAHFSDTVSLRDVQTSRTRMVQGVCSAHVISLISPSPLSHVLSAVLFPHGHFQTTFPSAPSLSNCTQSKSAGQARFCTSAEEFGYLANPTHSTLRGDIVTDDSGSRAVFTEQGSSVSQKTAAKVMDIISSLPGCSGQAADAISICTQVKMEDVSTFLKIPRSECPDIDYVYQSTHGQNYGPVWKIQLFLSKGICTFTFWQDSCDDSTL